MKKKILIISSIIFLMVMTIIAMYLIDRKRMKDNKSVIFSTWGYSYAPPLKINDENKQKSDNIVLNPNSVMRMVEYDTKTMEIDEDLNELQNLKYPTTINLSRALAIYVKTDINKTDYDELHDIFLLFKGKNKSFSITMSMLGEPLTNYKDFDNEYEYKQSLIDGNEIAILHDNNKDEINKKTYYTCIFKYDSVYFVVETIDFTQDEMVSLIKSIFNCDMKNIIQQESYEKTSDRLLFN